MSSKATRDPSPTRSVVKPAITAVLPSWVEADPLRGRAVDALGLQGVADRLADEILPGISVLTNRARYFALLAWARKACGARVDEQRIHRLEVALAVRESQLHAASSGEKDAERCRFVGSRNLAGARFASPPADPRDAYRVPVWRAYRASLRNLDLLDRDDALTDDGDALARRFDASCRPKDSSGKTMLPESACLSAMRSPEAVLIEDALGIRRKGKLGADDTSAPARRAALERELRGMFDGGFSVSAVLAAYESNRRRQPSRTVASLREAAIWERLSVGLHAVFLLWLHRIEKPTTAVLMIQQARRTRGASPAPHEDIPIDDQAADRAVRSIRRALVLRDRLADKQALPHSDPAVFELGEALVGASTPVDDVLLLLAERHFQAKGDDAWLRLGRRGQELARDADDKWQLPTSATLHGYRLGAFGQLLVDLRRARWSLG
jgi:hypothetical protein